MAVLTVRRDRTVSCEAAAGAIPALADDGEIPAATREHVETCLHCQADVARYRRMARDVHALRGEWVVPPEGALAAALAALHAQPANRRLGHGGGGAVATAAGAAAGVAGVAGVMAWRSRRRMLAG